eukprot:COSAG02_NODE_7316_length_3066_cov_17.625276_2_plen_55_part_00
MQLSSFNCMYITMSYYIMKYEFMGPDSAGVVRSSFRSASSSSLYYYYSGHGTSY